MFLSKIRPVSVIVSVSIALMVATVPAVHAGGFVSDSFCGTTANHAWKLQNEPSHGPAQNVYSDVMDAGAVCLDDVWNTGSGFTIGASTTDSAWAAYPNIGQGDEWGTRPVGTWLPFQPNADGNPVASVVTDAVQNQGAHNAAFDLWFNKSRNAWVGQNDGAEILIWTDCHDVCFDWYDWYVRIDGILWGVRAWTSHQRGPTDTGVTWLYTAYVALPSRDSVSGLHLNPFLLNAEAHHRLMSSWWLTGADYGFELCSGASGLYVRDYSLTGFGPVWTATARRTVAATASARVDVTASGTATVEIDGLSFTASATATGTSSATRTGTGTVTVTTRGLNQALATADARHLAAGIKVGRMARRRATTAAEAKAARAAGVSARTTAVARAVALARVKALRMSRASSRRCLIQPASAAGSLCSVHVVRERSRRDESAERQR
jgi:hypothetical protein